MRRETRRGDGGFTLLELLVAFAIAALGLTALYEAGMGSLGATRTAGRYEEAVSHARSHLAAIGALPLAEGESEADDGGGFRVRRRVAVVGSTAGAALYEVRVAVTWTERGTTRVVELASARVGPPERRR